MRKHTKTFHIRFTEKEYERLCKRAEQTGLPKSTYIRFMIDGCSPREKTPAVFWKYINKSNEVSGNLFNLLRTAQRLDVIDAERLETEIDNFRKLYMDIFYEVVGADKVDVKETLERGRQVAKLDERTE